MIPAPFRIQVDDLSSQAVADLLAEHLADMQATSPPESKHALDLEGLRQPEVIFWTAWSGDQLAGCAALKELSADHGEIKSMRTASRCRGQGVATALLKHVVAESERRGYGRLSLETGTMEYFSPARALYSKHQFTECPPFADYREDPNSVFMTRALSK